MKILNGPFRGADFYGEWKHSKRKILGVYEHDLNHWLESHLDTVDVLWDIGANDGYFTFGCAHRFLNHQKPEIIVFEPDIMNLDLIKSHTSSEKYRRISWLFYGKFLGGTVSDNSVTFDSVLNEHPDLIGRNTLIKMDIEGAENLVIPCAEKLMTNNFRWVVETHGPDCHEVVKEMFERHNRLYIEINPTPHWLFGHESRALETRWIVS